MNLHKPLHSVLFIGLIVGSIYLSPLISPSMFDEINKIELAPPPVWSELLDEEKIVETPEITIITDSVPNDTLGLQCNQLDSVLGNIPIVLNRWRPSYDTIEVSDDLKFHGNHEAFEKLGMFFTLIEKIHSTDNSPIHVFHFGDSQIECDRITGAIRSSWQKSWGGSGPGLIPLIQPVPALSIRQNYSGNISRYTRFGLVDSTLEHSCYGAMAAFCRVHDYGTLSLWPHPQGFKLNKSWASIEIGIGSAPLGGDVVIRGDITPDIHLHIPPSKVGNHKLIKADLSGQEEELTIEFEGYEMDVTAIRLGTNYGIQVHNVPMRGSAGMIFRKLDENHFRKYMNAWDVGLMIFQYGGNAVPYISDSTEADRYAKRFASQLRYLQKINPGTPIIVIGPSDMGATIDSSNITYPMLGPIRAALKKHIVNEGCLYWDLSEVMGGAGSMETWSKTEPRLSSPDLIHFTSNGARKVGELFDFMFRYEHRKWANRVNHEKKD